MLKQRRARLWRAAALGGACLALTVACQNESTKQGRPAGGSSGSVAAGSGGAAGAVPSTPDGCLAITIPETAFSWSGRGGFWGEGVYATVPSSPIPTELRGWTGLVIKFRQSAPGEYAFGSGDDADVATCAHCPVLLQDVHGDNPTAAWFPRKGKLILESSDPTTGAFVGRLEGIVLRETKQVGGLQYAGFTANATCVALADTRFDTRPVPGRACTSAGDCPNNAAQSCDPKTLRCTSRQCAAMAGRCDGGDVCLSQDPAYDVGGCYASCSPRSAGGCPDGSECVALDALATTGACKLRATKSPDAWQECTPTQTSTGCGAKSVCTTHAVFWHYDYCYPTCDFFAADPACPGDSQCMLLTQNAVELQTSWLCGRGDCYEGGVCRKRDFDLWWISKSKLGDRCEDDRAGYACDVRTGAVRNGVCAGPDNRCRRLCRTSASDCAQGERCEPLVVDKGEEGERQVPGVGVCL